MACYTTVNIDGFIMPGTFPEDTFRKALTYQPDDDDVFVVTFPKCGTTWMMYILYLIRNNCPTIDFKMRDHIPWLELYGIENVQKLTRPRLIKSHLPFNMLPWNNKAKYIFVARNPLDCCVSFYHHVVGFPGYEFKDGRFDDFFETFMKGVNDNNDYFDYLNSIFNERLRDNVLFLTYESMKENLPQVIKDVAKFLGGEFQEKVADTAFLEKVVEMSSISFMKKYENSFHSGRESGEPFVRKGIVGDYKNMMSEEQIKLLSDRFRKKCSGSEVLALWEKYGIPASG